MAGVKVIFDIVIQKRNQGRQFIKSTIKVLHNISGDSFGTIDPGNFTKLIQGILMESFIGH